MSSLWIVYETYTNGYKIEILDIFSVIAILCGILVIVSKNPIVSVLFLIGLFACISCYLIMLGLSFIGLSYLIVYIGAVKKSMKYAALVQIQLYKVFLILIKFYKGIVLTFPSSKTNISSIPAQHRNYSNIKLKYLLCSAQKKNFYSTLASFRSRTRSLGLGRRARDLEYENFIKWFVGFSDGESNFTIVFQKDKNGIITGASFRFTIQQKPRDISISRFIHRPFISNIYNSSRRPYGITFRKSYSTVSNKDFKPNWVTGFTDAEGSFTLQLKKNQPTKTGWAVSPNFVIHLHSKDTDLLYSMQNFFGVGRVFIDKKTSASYAVGKLDDIVKVIIPHFDKYPLQSGKIIDYRLWVECVNLIAKKEHLNLEGLTKIISIKSILNKGLSEDLKTIFKDIDNNPLKRLEHNDCVSPLDPYWVSGFSEGDSSFYVTVAKKTKYIRIIYSIGLHARDLPLIYRIQRFFGGSGNIVNYKNSVQYTIADINTRDEILIPHFDTYLLQGNKLHNYLIWKEISRLVTTKSHLTSEGFEQITDLKAKLNIW